MASGPLKVRKTFHWCPPSGDVLSLMWMVPSRESQAGAVWWSVESFVRVGKLFWLFSKHVGILNFNEVEIFVIFEVPLVDILKFLFLKFLKFRYHVCFVRSFKILDFLYFLFFLNLWRQKGNFQWTGFINSIKRT